MGCPGKAFTITMAIYLLTRDCPAKAEITGGTGKSDAAGRLQPDWSAHGNRLLNLGHFSAFRRSKTWLQLILVHGCSPRTRRLLISTPPRRFISPLTSDVWDTRAEEGRDEEKKEIYKATLLNVTNNSRFALYQHV